MGELARHESAADDDQMLGHVGDAHDGVAGVIRHAAFGDRVGDHGARAGRDHHLVGGELVAVIGAQLVAAVGKRRPKRVWLANTWTFGEERR